MERSRFITSGGRRFEFINLYIKLFLKDQRWHISNASQKRYKKTKLISTLSFQLNLEQNIRIDYILLKVKFCTSLQSCYKWRIVTTFFSFKRLFEPKIWRLSDFKLALDSIGLFQLDYFIRGDCANASSPWEKFYGRVVHI